MMEDKNNKRVAKPDDKKSVPKNETHDLPRPLPSPWSTSTQAYHNFGSAATSSVNPAGSLFYSPWLGSQIWNRPTPIQYGSVYQSRSFPNFYPMAATGVGQSSLLASADRIQRNSAESNKNLMGKGLQSQESRPSILLKKSLQPTSKDTQESKENGKRPSILLNKSLQPTSKVTQESKENEKRPSILVNKSLQPTSKVTQESKEYGKRPSIPKTNGEGLKRSVASESKETAVVGHDVKNAGGSTKFKIKLQDLPSIKLKQSSMMPGNGAGAHNVTSNEPIKKNVVSKENCNAVHENRNIASDHFEANPTKLNQKLSTDPTASGNNPELKEKESDETKEKRKRHAKKTSSKRTKRKIMKLQDIPSSSTKQESSMMPGNGGAAQNVTSNENCNAVHENRNIASDDFEANPTELNQKLSSEPSASRNNPQLKKKESDEEREQRRKLAKKIASKRSRMKIKMEREKIIESLENLDAENTALRKELHDRTIECEKITEENNALLDELIEKYGEETIMNILNAQPTDLIAGGGQSSNNNN